MSEQNLNTSPPWVDSFEEYEKIKLQIETLENAAKEIIQRHQLPNEPLSLFSEGTNIVFACGKQRVIKIYPPFHKDQFASEVLVLNHLQGKISVKIPTIEYQGEIAGWPYIVISRLTGTLLEELWDTLDHNNKMIIIRELGALIREAHTLPTEGLETIDCHWKQFIAKQISQCLAHHRKWTFQEPLLQQLPAYVTSIQASLLLEINQPVILTGEYTPMNILVQQQSGIWHIDGMIDFADTMLGKAEYDLDGPGTFLIQGNKQLLKAFLSAYGYAKEEMTMALSHQLTAITLLHRYSYLKTKLRIKNWQSRVTSIKDLEDLIWGF